MFYGEFISLDEARAKGVLAPKAIHRHATPENVFFDDTRICYFNLSLSRQGKKAAAEFPTERFRGRPACRRRAAARGDLPRVLDAGTSC